MLLSLFIKDAIFINNLEIDFKDGLVVFTGETGAGKSIIMESILLALGGKSNPSIISNSSDAATFILALKNHPKINNIFHDLNIDDSDELQVKRVQFNDGRTKSYINDVPVSLSTVKKLSSCLVEFHGQNEDLSFINQSNHIDIIDSFGDYTTDIDIISEISAEIKKIQNEIMERNKILDQTASQKTYLEEICQEIEDLNLMHGEEDKLFQRRKLLLEGSRVIETLSKITSLINADNGIEELSGIAQREISRLEAIQNSDIIKIDSELVNINDSLSKINTLIDKVQDQMGADNSDLETVEKRLFAIKSISRKYNIPTDEILNFFERTSEQLNNLNDGKEEIIKMEEGLRKLCSKYDDIAIELSKKRELIIREFDKRLLDELNELKFPSIKVKTVIHKNSVESRGPKGIDEVSIMVSTSKEREPELITKVASGGELSRIILAIKSLKSASHDVDTLIFDEIDSGVSGSTASAIGKKLASLSKTLQIFSVTHSPQVASKANHHYLIKKIDKSEDDFTIEVTEIEEGERIEEIARMLSGEKITNQAREASKSLMYEDE